MSAIYKLILFMCFAILQAYAKIGCPEITVDFLAVAKATSLADIAEGLGNVLSTTDYDTSEMKYYVITPSSYPKFVNPKGDHVDWSGIGCEGKPIFFSCHGWGMDGLFPNIVDIVRTFVQQYNGCAVSCDYAAPAFNPNLYGVAHQTGNIAEAAANYIENNICRVSNCKENLQLHGLSWGGHVCGIAGYLLGQRGLKPIRMIASDAAGIYFNTLPPDAISERLSTESAATVINIKTSAFVGSSLPMWSHQSQYIGLCGSNQDQCRGLLPKEVCDHGSSIYVAKSTMMKDYPLIKLRKCSSCPYTTLFSTPSEGQCTEEEDYLGWQSTGKRGLFVIKTLPECLNVTLNYKLD